MFSEYQYHQSYGQRDEHIAVFDRAIEVLESGRIWSISHQNIPSIDLTNQTLNILLIKVDGVRRIFGCPPGEPYP